MRDGYRSAAVSLVLLTEDGRRLRLDREVDGTPADAASRPDLDFPDQWNERRISLTDLAGGVVSGVELRIDPPPARAGAGRMLEGWIEGLRITTARRPGAAASPSERVPTTRGSHSSPQRSRGLTQPLAGVPHGGIHVTPATDLSNPHWNYTWNAHGTGPNPSLAGILISRSPSIWIGDRGAVALRIGRAATGSDHPEPEEFSHDDEIAEPHRYRLTTRGGIRIDAAATASAVLVEIALPSAARLELCAPGAPLTHAAVETGPDGAVHVRAAVTLPSPHESDPLVGYYSLTLSGAPLSVVRSDGALVLDAGSGAIRMEAGASQLSIAQAERARSSLEAETIDTVASAAQRNWDELLSRVDPLEASDEQRVLVASDLYRLFLYPTRHHEDTADGPSYPSPTRRRGADSAQQTGREIRSGRMLTNNGFWDTYRASWPAYAFLAPDRSAALVEGMMEHVRDAGWSPRWTAGTPLDAMVGTSFDVVASDMVSAGIDGIDLDTAYAAALRNATAASPDRRFGRKGMPEALSLGYVDSGVAESVSWTMEAAISDGGAAALARELARTSTGSRAARLRAEARYLAHRARGYRSLWDPVTRFFRPRTTDGGWADEPFDPRVWGGAHTETNAWGSRFAAPHDGAGLVSLFGGPGELGDALDEFFREQETARAEFAGEYGRVIHEMPEARDVRRGMWGLSNQPAHHVPWLYAYSDRPWRTDEILTDAARRMFRGVRIGQGFPGDEDNGEMSAWHLLTLLGFAPFAPGSGRLLVTAPQLARTVVRPRGAEDLEIVARRRDDGDLFIREVRWNGREWTSPSIGISELHGGGLWEVELGPEPVPWCEPLPSTPHFAAEGATSIALRTIGSADARSIGADGTLEIDLVDAVPEGDPALLVIGLRDAGTHSFRVESGGDDIAFREEAWEWAEQARPFEAALPKGARQVRIRWESGDAEVVFVQVLAP